MFLPVADEDLAERILVKLQRRCTAVQDNPSPSESPLDLRGFGERVKVRFEVGAPRMLSQSRKLQGRLVRQLFRIWRYSERLIEPRLKIAMRKQIHAQQRDQDYDSDQPKRERSCR